MATQLNDVMVRPTSYDPKDYRNLLAARLMDYNTASDTDSDDAAVALEKIHRMVLELDKLNDGINMDLFDYKVQDLILFVKGLK